MPTTVNVFLKFKYFKILNKKQLNLHPKRRIELETK